MEDRELLITLHETEGIGWTTINRLLMGLNQLNDVNRMNKAEFAALGIGYKQVDAILANRNSERILQKLRIYEQATITITTILDETYPELLRTIAEPPMVLYSKGDLSLFQLPNIGIVGTRTPTVYGKKVADELAYELASRGFGVVSGLARGIDTCAHRGALRAEQGKTIAVLGNAIDQVYPPENTGCYQEIAQRGLVVSEYSIGTKQHPGMFPQRNRIIAGLSLGTVVVEAAERSGSLITADLALEASRDVFAVPGPINSPKSRGCNELLKQGAKVISSAEDIIEEYKHLSFVSQLKQKELSKHPTFDSEMNEEERRIYELLIGEAKSFDVLLNLSHYNFGLLHSVLLSLLMK